MDDEYERRHLKNFRDGEDRHWLRVTVGTSPAECMAAFGGGGWVQHDGAECRWRLSRHFIKASSKPFLTYLNPG